MNIVFMSMDTLPSTLWARDIGRRTGIWRVGIAW